MGSDSESAAARPRPHDSPDAAGATEAPEKTGWEASSSESRFFAAANHDLRQPIHALQLMIATLKATDDPSRRDDIIANIEHTLSVLAGYLDSLLDLSKLETGTLRASAADFPLADLVARVVDGLRDEAARQGVALRVVPTRATVRSDSLCLERILKHFLANAVRAAPAGRVLVGCRRRGTALRLEVWDDGAGLAEADLGRIFDPFTRLDDKGRPQSRGLGLGLTIAKATADHLGHRIEVVSKPHRATMFAVELPLGSKGARQAADRRASRILAAGIEGAPLLVIAEEAEAARRLQALLESWGATVGRSASGEGSMTGYGMAPAAVIMQAQRHDAAAGEEAIRAVRQRCQREIPAILLLDEVPSEPPDVRPDPSIHRLEGPLDPAKLRALLRYLLSGSPGV